MPDHAPLPGELRYSITDSPLDRMLVAATVRGVCAVAFASSDDDLLAELASRFPDAQRTRDDSSLANTTESVLTTIGSGSARAGELTLDVTGSPFQQRAWQAMRAIPRGATLTYGELAERLGSPGGAIAVGNACAANAVAVLIPCHRVLAHGGKLHNYRWGVERKRRLLAIEGAGLQLGLEMQTELCGNGQNS